MGYRDNYIDWTEDDKIRDLFMGRKVVKVEGDVATLDNGVVVRFPDTDGGCSCSSGCYDLTALNRVDNIITNVEVYADPHSDWGDTGEGVYRIYVYAENEQLMLAEWEGSDGNGYYGTGFDLIVETVDNKKGM